MTSALFYLWFVSLRNRLVARFKRLKQPKYLIGAIVGGAYFYFYFFRWMFMAGMPGRHHQGGFIPPAVSVNPLLYESIGALILLVIVLLAWVIPHKRAALTFTEAEIAFLFPAPVRRRTLIHFKLFRSQFGILMSALFFTLVSGRFRASGHAVTHAVGWWVILSTLNLHFLGSSFARTLLLEHGISNWKRRLVVLALVAAGAIWVGVWALKEIPELRSADFADVQAITDYAQRVLVSGPLPYLLFPFRLVVKPYLAPDWGGFSYALWPATLLLLVHYFWVVRSNVAFEEASVEASQKLAEKISAMRAGHWQANLKKRSVKRPPFRLSAHGFQPVALLWKNLISAGSAFTLRTWIVVAATLFGMSIGLRGAAHDANWIEAVGFFAAFVGCWAVLIGPQLVRMDLRQDLHHADVLKVFPMHGWQIVLGELLAPAVILTGVQWLLLLIATVFFAQAGNAKFSAGFVLALGLGVAVILPMLNLISLLIPNAAVLLFPAWFQSSRESAQGIEATGQRLVFVLGQFLAFLLSLVPAAVIFAGFFFILFKLTESPILAVPVSSVAAALILAIEAGLGVVFLGRLFERFDISAELLN